MTPVSVYNFTDYVEFLRLACELWASRRQRSMTLYDWADRLGYKSPRSLAMILNGQRLPSQAMTDKLADELLETAPEKEYFKLLVELAYCRQKHQPVADVIAKMRLLNPELDQTLPLDSATFSYIAEWYHIVIKQLIATPSFSEDIDTLRDRLRGKATAAEIKTAIAVLERLGFIRHSPVTGKLMASGQGIRTTADVPSEAIKLHHQQMLHRSLEALAEQDVREREFTSVTLRFAPDQVDEAKVWLRKMRDDFHQHFANNAADEVFQFNMQFFAHTKKESVA